jgi:hypothetical protein
MDFDEARDYLKNAYIEAGLNLVDEHKRELFFRRPPRERMLIRIPEHEIKEYAEFEQLRPTFQKLPTECSICSPNYREHQVTWYDPRRFPVSRDRVFVFGEQSDDILYAEVGPATTPFINFFRFDDAYCQLSLERMDRPYLRRHENESVDMFETLYKPFTVRVYNLQARDVEAALKSSSPVIDACLFELSYLKKITLKLEEEWPRRRPRVRPFRFEESVTGDQLPLPQVRFNPDIIRFYQRGMGTYDPVDQFLSFYHVLEYYFVAVSDGQLYSKLSRRINDPRFSTTPSHLDRIIQDTLNHKRETDETEMLKLVLKEYVEEAELIEFIEAYEEYLGDKLYTKKRTIFGESIEIRLDPDHVVGNLAKRVKVIRNALVHSSDRYERQQRYIPTAKAENMIRREIPLMKYLAERVIIAAAN